MTLLHDLTRAKALFQQRAVLANLVAMQYNAIGEVNIPHNLAKREKRLHNVKDVFTNEQCPVCGDYDCTGSLQCETGDGI